MRPIVNPSTEKEIERLKKRFMPAPETAFDRQLHARMDAGLQRVAANGLSLPSDDEDLLPPIAVDAFRGRTITQIQIDILHRGRRRAYLRFLTRKAAEELAAQEPGSSSPLAKRRKRRKPRTTKTSFPAEI